MEQMSDVKNRAEKLYKNSKEKFGLLIREIVSNSIHSTIIKANTKKNTDYIPSVNIDIQIEDEKAKVVVTDNGEGFNEINCKYFTHLDTRNKAKDDLHLHPQGQGRLAIIFFSDYAHYNSTYIDKNEELKNKEFDYPEYGPTLFNIEDSDGNHTDKQAIETVLTMKFNKTQTYKRAATFFYKYDDIEKLRNWFIENFFPFFMENKTMSIILNYNGDIVEINKEYIKEKVENISFSVDLDRDSMNFYDFKLWLVKKEGTPKAKNDIECFARQLKATIDGGKLVYEIDLPYAYDWFLTSNYFDKQVDQKGEEIEIQIDYIQKIQLEMKLALDNYFDEQIKKNRRETEKNIKYVKKKFHSISSFIDEGESKTSNRILNDKDIIDQAIENKGKAEKNYWIKKEENEEETDKLINSSLYIYIDYRNRVLQKLHKLIQKYNDNGTDKRELEDDIHDLFFKRGENLNNSERINHLHNLWILDDKYTIFFETFEGMSTKRGQKASDIYFWMDNPNPSQIKELLILELKSTTKAHNAGNKYESMIAQVKRYAKEFYKNPTKILNWNINPDLISYSGIILARKSDVHKELNSDNTSGEAKRIPFLESSWFFNEKFSINTNNAATPEYKEIRIEMYSYEDIHKLATNRNTVFFKLLNGEYEVESNS